MDLGRPLIAPKCIFWQREQHCHNGVKVFMKLYLNFNEIFSSVHFWMRLCLAEWKRQTLMDENTIVTPKRLWLRCITYIADCWCSLCCKIHLIFDKIKNYFRAFPWNLSHFYIYDETKTRLCKNNFVGLFESVIVKKTKRIQIFSIFFYE